jgi:hypothetical protein
LFFTRDLSVRRMLQMIIPSRTLPVCRPIPRRGIVLHRRRSL